MELVQKLPQERWAERDFRGRTLLHYACMGPNAAAVEALVKNKLVDVSACDCWKDTPAHYAALYGQARALEILCATGASLDIYSKGGLDPFAIALITIASHSIEIQRILIANGARLSTVRPVHQPYIGPTLVAFEQGVLSCRTAVSAMLRVKRAGKLWRWDKFLLREVAYALWATRYDNKWQN